MPWRPQAPPPDPVVFSPPPEVSRSLHREGPAGVAAAFLIPPPPVESHSPPVIATALHRIAINSGGKAPLCFRRCSGRVWPRRHPRSMVRGAPRVPRAAAGTREERGGGRWPVRGLACPGAAPARGRHGAGGA